MIQLPSVRTTLGSLAHHSFAVLDILTVSGTACCRPPEELQA